jgi:hypothetical protein
MPVQKVPAEDEETVRDVVGEEAAAVAEAVPAVEDPQPNATAIQVESTALLHSTMKPVGYTAPSPSTISTGICATIATVEPEAVVPQAGQTAPAALSTRRRSRHH